MASVEQSWEECVNQVCMAGSPPDMQNLKANWQIWQRRLAEIHQELEEFKTSVAQTFRGSVADAYQERLKSINEDITKMGESHRPIEGLLDTASTSLAKAQNEMPVPSDMINDIRERPRLVAPGEFRESLSTSWLQDLGAKYADLGGEVVGKFDRALDWFTDDNKEEANRILANLNDTQYREVGRTSDATVVDPKQYTSNQADPYANQNPGGTVSGAPKIGGAGGGGGAGSFDPPSGSTASFDPPGGGTGSFPGSGTGGSDFGGGGGVGSGGFPNGSGGVGGIGSGSGFDPSAGGISADDWSGTGLAGAGGPSSGGLGGLGSSGLGAGGGGLGSGAGGLAGGGGAGVGGGLGGGAGLGAGGLGAAGLGAGLAGGAGRGQVGKGVGMPKGAGGLTSANIGRGGAGRGGAAGAGMMGGAGGGLGHGGNDGPTRDTWLHEDEDVWGTGSGNSSNWSFGDS